MQTKKEAALAGAAAMVSGELDEAGQNIYSAQGNGKYGSRLGEYPEAGDAPQGRTTPQSAFPAGGPSDDRNVRDEKTPVDQILSRIGRAVLLPIQPGKKCPIQIGWQKTTQEVMEDPAYVSRLNGGGNIGVLLGAASNGLCTIDLDQAEEVEPILTLNPRLRSALRTRRSRGGNIWIRIEGGYPPLAKLKTNSGDSWGEWRADGSQTVIHGAAWNPFGKLWQPPSNPTSYPWTPFRESTKETAAFPSVRSCRNSYDSQHLANGGRCPA